MSQTLARASVLVQYPALISLPAQRLDLYLEQVAAAQCKTAGLPPILAVHAERKKAVFYKPRCKLWSCASCAEINARLWTWRAVHGCRQFLDDGGQHVDFVTITSHEKLDAAGSIAVLPKAWPRLRKRIARAAPGWQFYAVPEGHRNGRVHIHMLTTAQLPKRWWKDNARAVGMGYQSDVQEVKKAGSVAAYVGKYLSKSLQFTNWQKGFRRVRTSQAWPQLPDPDMPAGWQQEAYAPGAAIDRRWRQLSDAGYMVVLADHHLAWSIIKSDQ